MKSVCSICRELTRFAPYRTNPNFTLHEKAKLRELKLCKKCLTVYLKNREGQAVMVSLKIDDTNQDENGMLDAAVNAYKLKIKKELLRQLSDMRDYIEKWGIE